VTDTGVGIPATESERVFDQFTKLDSFNEGLGLGLTLCRKIITLLGGTILLDTTYVGGARFVITLPINVS
jgi:signal transduction histidine kinase